MNKIDLQYHYYMADNPKQGNSLPDLTADRPTHKPPTGKRDNPAHKSEGDIIDPMESNLGNSIEKILNILIFISSSKTESKAT